MFNSDTMDDVLCWAKRSVSNTPGKEMCGLGRHTGEDGTGS